MSQPTILFCSYLSSAEVTATSTLTGTDPDDVIIATEDTYHQPASTSSYSIVIDAGTSITVDSLALLGANMDGTTVEIRGSTDNFSASDVQVKAGTALTSALNAAYLTFTEASYRYWKLNISGHPSNFRIAHVCFDSVVDYPYFEEDPDIGNVKPEGRQLISQAGVYVGSNQTKAMREIRLNWGEVTDSELVVLKAWSAACIESMHGFFLVPDQEETDIFFGWLDDGGKFSAPLENGVYKVAANTMTTRAV